MNARPNFFIIGAPRSGTTSMFSYLREHPDVAMAARKEPHHFCSDLLDADFITDRGDYLALYDHVATQYRVGEASVWYLYSNQASAQIADFDPEVRLIALLRNPLEMLPSIFWHHVYTGFEVSDDFETAYRSRRATAASDGAVRQGDSFRRRLDYSQVARYGEQLERFYMTFPREQIHVLLFDDLRADPAGTYKATTEFLGIDPGFAPEFRRFNPQRRVRSQAMARSLWQWQRAKASTPPTRGWLSEGARRVRTKGIRVLSSLNSVPAHPPGLSPSMRALIISDHAEDILKLSDLTGRDVSHWFD